MLYKSDIKPNSLQVMVASIVVMMEIAMYPTTLKIRSSNP